MPAASQRRSALQSPARLLLCALPSMSTQDAPPFPRHECLELQEFEKKEHKLKARAATNLAFLYSLEGDSANAERYADLAIATDKYSAQALVNKVTLPLPLCRLGLGEVSIPSDKSAF